MKSLIFPVPVRTFTGQRWVRISLRTGHLMSMAFLMGQTAQGVPFAEQPIAVWGTVLTGLAFVGVEMFQSCLFFLQLKGLAVVVKAVLLGFALAAPAYALICFGAAIVIGGVSSHMPGKFRYWSWWHLEVRKE